VVTHSREININSFLIKIKKTKIPLSGRPLTRNQHVRFLFFLSLSYTFRGVPRGGWFHLKGPMRKNGFRWEEAEASHKYRGKRKGLREIF